MIEERGWTDGVMLPDDIMEDIILRLPPEGVAKFKCASKSWRLRLSDPSFAAKYRTQNTSVLCFFSNQTYNIHRCVSADDLSCLGVLTKRCCWNWKDPNCAVAAVASSGNLVVYFECPNVVKEGWSVKPTCIGNFFIADPIAGSRLDLPPPPRPFRASNPIKSFLVYGFAYDRLNFSSRDDPTTSFVFCEVTADLIIDSSEQQKQIGLFVNKYCSCHRTWIATSLGFNEMLRPCGLPFALTGRAVYLNSHLHLLVEEPFSLMVAYNPIDDNLSLKPTPGPAHESQYVDYVDYGDNHFGICCSCRHSAAANNRPPEEYFCTCRYLGKYEADNRLLYIRITGNSEFRMWILEDYYASQYTWSPRGVFLIDTTPLISSPSFYGNGGRVFWSTTVSSQDVRTAPPRNVDVVDVELYLVDGQRSVFSYNCTTGKVKTSSPNCLDVSYGDPYSTSPLIPYHQHPFNNDRFFQLFHNDHVMLVDGHPIPPPPEYQLGCYVHIGLYELMARRCPQFASSLEGLVARGPMSFGSTSDYSHFLRLEASLYGRIFMPMPRLISIKRINVWAHF